MDLFAASQPLVADLEAKERGHADELLVLAATALISAERGPGSTQAGLSKRLIQARYAASWQQHCHDTAFMDPP